MALIQTVAGRYGSTWDGADFGVTEDGYDFGLRIGGELINQSDAYGISLIEVVTQGADVTLSLNGLEAARATQRNVLSPYAPFGQTGPIGATGSLYGKTMVLTAAPGTPAAILQMPTSLTLFKAIIRPGYTATLKFTSKLRRVPLQLGVIISDLGGGVIGWGLCVPAI